MKKRFAFSIVVGVVTFLRTAEELWFRTNLDLPGIVFFSITAYFVGIITAYAVAERIRIKRVPARRSQVLITLDRKEWNSGKKNERSA